jgi:hypothetical protein
MIANPAADDLKDSIRIGKGREDQAELSIGKIELRLDDGCCRTNVYPINLGNEIH